MLFRSLRESGEKFTPEWEKEHKKGVVRQPSVFDPLFSTFKGMGELLGAFGPSKKYPVRCSSCGNINEPTNANCDQCGRLLRKLSRKEALALSDAKKKAVGQCKRDAFSALKRVKAAHGWIY